MAERFVLDAANQTTSWFDLTGAAERVCFMLTGNFDQPVSVHYSNNAAKDKGADYRADKTTYASADGPLEIPFGVARYVRFASGGAWGAGTTCTPSFAMTRNGRGELFAPGVQSFAGEVVTA